MPDTDRLRRTLGPVGATMLGLGSIVGTGVFVSLGLAADAAGTGVVLAVALAGGLALCNALSSAQLAAAHPVSGGTYEYGYRLLHPTAGFVAGWAFLLAKSASAATAALGVGAYALATLGRGEPLWQVGLAVAAVVLLTALVLGGMRRTSVVNTVIVAITLAALMIYVVAVGWAAGRGGPDAWLADSLSVGVDGMSWSGARGVLTATALAFVAYTGYGRVATLGEEVRDPQRTIPRAILLTLGVSVVLYLAVAGVTVAAVGAPAYAAATGQRVVDGRELPPAPLEHIADMLAMPWLGTLLAGAAITAMLGVLLNLLLGLSRVVLAMARRGDLPRTLGRVSQGGAAATPATLVMAAVIAGLALIGDVKTTWSFSAFCVLIYYALTNAAALRLPPHHRRYPRAFAWIGLAGCSGFAAFVDWRVLVVGAGLLVVAGVGHGVWRRAASSRV